MELTSALRSEIVRPLVTLVIPGATSLGPLFVQARIQFPHLSDYLEAHPTIAVLIALCSVVAAGLLLENLGSWFEVNVIDRSLSKKYPGFNRDWHNYLRYAPTVEPVGQRYLRTVHLRLKFELAMAPALGILLLGINWLNAELGFLSERGIWTTSILLILFFALLAYEAFQSAAVLAVTRFVLLSPRDTPLPEELAKS